MAGAHLATHPLFSIFGYKIRLYRVRNYSLLIKRTNDKCKVEDHPASTSHFRFVSEFAWINSQLDEVHTEVKSSFGEHLLDLCERFLTEVAELHQVFLLVLYQLTE